MARISKKLQKQIIEAVRAAHHEVEKDIVPDTHVVPPDQWSKDETAKADLIAECEHKAVKAIEKIFAVTDAA